MGFWEKTSKRRFDAENVEMQLNGQLVTVKVLHNPRLPPRLLLVIETRWWWNPPLHIRVENDALKITGKSITPSGHIRGGNRLQTYNGTFLQTIVGSPYHHSLLIEFGGTDSDLEVLHASSSR